MDDDDAAIASNDRTVGEFRGRLSLGGDGSVDSSVGQC